MMDAVEMIERGPPLGGIDPSDANVSELGHVADLLDAMLRRRGYEPLTTDQRDTLWSDYPSETAAMFDDMEAKCLDDAEAIELAREHVSTILGVKR